MFTNSILQAHVDDILIEGVPALSPPMGRGAITIDLSFPARFNYDMNAEYVDSERFRPNGWPWGGDKYEARWLHSQLIYVAHHYTHKLYEKFIEIGGLK